MSYERQAKPVEKREALIARRRCSGWRCAYRCVIAASNAGPERTRSQRPLRVDQRAPRTNTLFLAHSSTAVADVGQQILESILAANPQK
jgi:hypothetical protein